MGQELVPTYGLHCRAIKQKESNMRKFLIAIATVLALTGTAAAQADGDPGWYPIGPGSVTNCLSCVQGKIQFDMQVQQFEAERAARARALYDQQIEQRLHTLEQNTWCANNPEACRWYRR
jgi:hypothetical protein